MHERRYSAEIERLRSAERIERLELDRVVSLSREGIDVKTVLDAGTGSGLFAERFAKEGFVVTGIDASPEMVAASTQLVPGVEFRQATMESLPFADRSFDLVFLGLVLHEADDAVQALTECRRCAKLGVAALEWPYKDQDIGPPLEHRLRSEDVEALAKKAGFKSTSVVALKSLLLYQFTL